MLGPPPDLLADVTALTGIDPCKSSREHIFFDEDADPLLAEHLGNCESCAELALTVMQMGGDLAFLTDLEPDDGFVSDVMKATLPKARPLLAQGLRERLQTLIRRPRFAMESAFVLTLAVFLLTPLNVRAMGVRAQSWLLMDQADWVDPQVAESARRMTTAWVGQAAEFLSWSGEICHSAAQKLHDLEMSMLDSQNQPQMNENDIQKENDHEPRE